MGFFDNFSFSKLSDSIWHVLDPEASPDLEAVDAEVVKQRPTLWLLGKSGAGKSSLISAVTQLLHIEIGNGFQPCTESTVIYDFPTDNPIVRFMDTRGLGEAGYDPEEDLAKLESQNHCLVLVMKTDDPSQDDVLNALVGIRKAKRIKHLFIVHTATNDFSEQEATRLHGLKQKQLEAVWGQAIPSVRVDFDVIGDGEFLGQSALIDTLCEQLPKLHLLLDKDEHSSREQKVYETNKTILYSYASASAAAGALPAIGLVAVPSIQAKQFHALGVRYNIDWNKRTWAEFSGALGTSFLAQYGLNFAAREVTKLIPVYGQTAGAVVGAALSFAVTYGLGRAACYFFYQKSMGEPVDPDELKKLYKQAFNKGKQVAEDEAN